MMVLDPEGLLEDVHVEDLHLSGSTEQLLPVVAAMPLASAVDYSAVVGKTPSYSYSRLWELKDAGLLRPVRSGGYKAEGITLVLDSRGD